MRVLVTGGAGFLGTHIVAGLEAEGHAVRILDPLATRPSDRGDVRDLSALRTLFRSEAPEAVIHLAAVASVPRCEEDPRLCESVNLAGTLNVATAAEEVGARVVFASSAAVYGSATNRPSRVSDPLVATNVYGRSKILGERIVRERSADSVIFRIFNAYGPGCHRSYLVPDTIQALRAPRGAVALAGSGDTERDFVFVRDVVGAFVRAIRTPIRGTFNLGSGRVVRVRSVVALLLDLMGQRGRPFSFSGPRTGDFSKNWADLSAPNGLPGWAPGIDLRAGLAETVAAEVIPLEPFAEWVRAPAALQGVLEPARLALPVSG